MDSDQTRLSYVEHRRVRRTSPGDREPGTRAAEAVALTHRCEGSSPFGLTTGADVSSAQRATSARRTLRQTHCARVFDNTSIATTERAAHSTPRAPSHNGTVGVGGLRACSKRRRLWFDSRMSHPRNVSLGLSSNGRTPASHVGNGGSTPPDSTSSRDARRGCWRDRGATNPEGVVRFHGRAPVFIAVRKVPSFNGRTAGCRPADAGSIPVGTAQ